jgi:hypothetical protein
VQERAGERCGVGGEVRGASGVEDGGWRLEVERGAVVGPELRNRDGDKALLFVLPYRRAVAQIKKSLEL